MLTRRMSLPATEPAAKDPSQSPGLKDTNPSTGPPATVQNPKKLAQAEGLAKMTFELNVRLVNRRMVTLEQELITLIRATEDDKSFRQRNEERVQELYQEIMVLKHHMERVDDEQKGVKVTQEEFEKVQSETLALVEEFRDEVVGLKAFMEGLSKQIDELTDSAESGYVSQRRGVALGGDDMSPTQPLERHDSTDSHGYWAQSLPSASEIAIEGHDAAAIANAAHRVSDAIQSTRRWNHAHKTTMLPDDQFCVDYLKQQSKRDAKVAVFIQRGILRRIRRTRERSASKPKSLEEFCKGVSWEDVITTVRENLIQDEKSAIIAII